MQRGAWTGDHAAGIMQLGIMQQGSHSVEHAAGSMQQGTCIGDHAAGIMQHGACSVEHAAVIMQCGACNGEHAAGIMQPGIMQRGACRREHAAGSTQQAACSGWLSPRAACPSHTRNGCLRVHAGSRLRPPAVRVLSWWVLDSRSAASPHHRALGRACTKQAQLCCSAPQEPMIRPEQAACRQGERPRAGSRLSGQQGRGRAAGEAPGPRHREPGLGHRRSQPGQVEGRESKPAEIKMTSPAMWRELQKIRQNK